MSSEGSRGPPCSKPCRALCLTTALSTALQSIQWRSTRTVCSCCDSGSNLCPHWSIIFIACSTVLPQNHGATYIIWPLCLAFLIQNLSFTPYYTISKLSTHCITCYIYCNYAVCAMLENSSLFEGAPCSTVISMAAYYTGLKTAFYVSLSASPG